MLAVSGSVVALPLVGCVPLQPPEAEQDCASCACHCRVVAMPMGTLFWVAASVTAGFCVVTEVGSVVAVWPFADCWHAANPQNDAQTMSQVDRREAVQPRKVVAVERNEDRRLPNR